MRRHPTERRRTTLHVDQWSLPSSVGEERIEKAAMHDVYAYGVIAPSMLIELSDDYPALSGYAEIGGVYPSIGGEAAGGAYVLARLGIATKLSGNLLSDDDSTAQVLGLLSAAGVDCSAVGVRPDVSPVTEFVLATGAARTVLGTYRKLMADAAWSEPSKEDIRNSRVVCLDPFFGEASHRAARWCVETETPYVTVDTAPDSEIARSAEVLVVSEEFAAGTFETSDPGEIHAAYTRQCAGLVILTRGSRPLVNGGRGEQQQECRPFPVEARDTTGAGDSFRAGIIYGMLRGYDTRRLVETACAVAAIVSQRPPGVLNSPTEQELEEFLGRHV
jgi:sugar/nucleoside kinase (ribokinase family)